MSLRVVFMGTPDFSVPALKALSAAFEIVGVYSQPPRNAGRGQRERLSPVHRTALDLNIPVFTPERLKSEAEYSAFRDLEADVAVVAAYGLILPKEILSAPRLGCINIHASLLPRWRGAAPIQRAILAGDTSTGISVMRMDEGLDTGDVLDMQSLPITAESTGQSVHDALATLGATMIVPSLQKWADGTVPPQPQPDIGVTYAAKIDKSEARIDWRRSAFETDRQIRAFSPFPGAWFEFEGERIKALMSRVESVPSSMDNLPGTVLDNALLIAAGDGGAVRITSLQRAGKSAMDAATFLRGNPINPGAVLA